MGNKLMTIINAVRDALTDAPMGAPTKLMREMSGGSLADVVVLGDEDGQLLGTTANPLPVALAGADNVTINVDTANVVQPSPEASATRRLLSAAASVNATNVKNAAGKVYKITGENAAVAKRYLKLYDKATAPTVGTDAPIWTQALPASGPFTLDFPVGLAFASGIGFGLTTGAADADTGALTAADIVNMNIAYE
jgi:hypothetical protein